MKTDEVIAVAVAIIVFFLVWAELRAGMFGILLAGM